MRHNPDPSIPICSFLENLIFFAALSCDHQQCSGRSSANVSTMTSPVSGYISSAVAVQSQCGSNQCPYIIQVTSGRRINLTLHDFTVTSAQQTYVTSSTGGHQQSGVNKCQWYFVVFDGSTRKDVSRCDERVTSEGNDPAVQHVYMSQSNRIRIELFPMQQQQQQSQPLTPVFLVHYQGKS